MQTCKLRHQLADQPQTDYSHILPKMDFADTHRIKRNATERGKTRFFKWNLVGYPSDQISPGENRLSVTGSLAADASITSGRLILGSG